MTANEMYQITGQPEYEREFWNAVRGKETFGYHLERGRSLDSGAYMLPLAANRKYEEAVTDKSVFRKIASVHTSYDAASDIYATDSDDLAEFVEEFGTIDLKDGMEDFTRVPVGRNKLATLVKLPSDFVHDSLFDFEKCLIDRFARSFGRAEDNAYLNGSGENEPVGILNDEGGATIGKTTAQPTYDNVIDLFFSVAPEYRDNGVWMMNDATALALRKLKDSDGNYLWNPANDTVLGKKVVISNYMPSADAGSKPIAFGDFSFYWIVKRSPLTVRALTERYATLQQIGFLGYEFLDGKLIRPEAIKVLKVSEPNGETD